MLQELRRWDGLTSEPCEFAGLANRFCNSILSAGGVNTANNEGPLEPPRDNFADSWYELGMLMVLASRGPATSAHLIVTSSSSKIDGERDRRLTRRICYARRASLTWASRN
jgi:hypothetical protein